MKICMNLYHTIHWNIRWLNVWYLLKYYMIRWSNSFQMIADFLKKLCTFVYHTVVFVLYLFFCLHQSCMVEFHPAFTRFFFCNILIFAEMTRISGEKLRSTSWRCAPELQIFVMSGKLHSVELCVMLLHIHAWDTYLSLYNWCHLRIDGVSWEFINSILAGRHFQMLFREWKNVYFD